MPNTLTGLIPTLYEALDVVARERVGFAQAVSRNSSAERAAVGQQILIPVTPTAVNDADNTPAVTAPNTGDQTIGNLPMTITKSKHVPVRWNGEERQGLQNAGIYQNVNVDRFAQAFRRLTNLIEFDLALEAKNNASRAVGTAGTTPFGTLSNLTDFANVWKVLDDNGTPPSELKLVLNNSSMVNLRGVQAGLFRANEAGTDELLRDGKIMRVQGFDIHQSGQLSSHTKGTGTGYLVNNVSGYAVGETSIAVDTGTGTIVAGDVITFAGDANRYVVVSALAGGVIRIGSNGLQLPLADNTAITVGNNYSPNLAFHKNAMTLITRPPAMPDGGDMADDIQLITDPISGIVYEVALYKQFLQNVVHVRVAWGVKAVKSDFIVQLLG